MTILIIATALIGLIFLWLLLRVIVRKWLKADTARLKAEIKKLVIKPKTKQTTLTPFMYDSYPYERHWNLEGWEDTEYSEAEGYESSAEMDLEDEEEASK
jgi:hypothetical protein